MIKRASQKCFLDTSFVVPWLTGRQDYKNYLRESVAGSSLYVSDYVLMEFRRTLICPMVEFWLDLQKPENPNVTDAILSWREKFQNRKLKAILGLTVNLTSDRDLDLEDPSHKERASRHIDRYIRRLWSQTLRKLKNVGRDRTRCSRAAVRIIDLRSFYNDFNATRECRAKCHVGSSFLRHYLTELQCLVRKADGLKQNSETRGFCKIAERVQWILQGGENRCTCSKCGGIGDAIIALDAPHDMCIEHLDHSFDYLCDARSHRKHPCQSAYMKSLALNPPPPPANSS